MRYRSSYTWQIVSTALLLCHFTLYPQAVKSLQGGELTTAGIRLHDGRLLPLTSLPSDSNWDGRFSSQGMPSIGSFATVNAIAVAPNGDAYIGGSFRIAGNIRAINLAKWDEHFGGWSAVGKGVGDLNSTVNALAFSNAGDILYVGGNFSTAFNDDSGQVSANNIAQWDVEAHSWSALGSGTNQAVIDIKANPANNDIYVGGIFTQAGGLTSASRIAKWNGSSWSALGSGVGGTGVPDVWAININSDGLFIGGDFSRAGTDTVLNGAKWDGLKWRPLGKGVVGRIRSLEWTSGELIVGGTFDTVINNDGSKLIAHNIAMIDLGTSTWSALGAGTGGPVYALARFNTTLYVGGGFTNAGGNSANFIATWDGVNWSPIVSGTSNGTGSYVFCISIDPVNPNTILYIGGDFQSFRGGRANAVARLDYLLGWQTLGFGIDFGPAGAAYVNSLASSNSGLYVAGNINLGWSTYIQGHNFGSGIGRWMGDGWLPLGNATNPGTSYIVNHIAATDSDVFAAGYFTMAGGDTAPMNTARYNIPTNTWSVDVNNGLVGPPLSFGSDGHSVWSSGGFEDLTSGIQHIGRWDGSAWSKPPGGPYEGNPTSINALTISGDQVYIGGYFYVLSQDDNPMGIGPSATNVGLWNNGTWAGLISAAGSVGSDGGVGAIAVNGDDIYIGGGFSNVYNGTPTPIPANNIARWNGNGWEPLGTGCDNTVTSLAIAGGALYAGGYFTSAGGVTVNGVAKWDGTSWSALGSGVGGSSWNVLALASTESNSSEVDLYLGGSFTLAGGKPSLGIARWVENIPNTGGSLLKIASHTSKRINSIAFSGQTGYAVGEGGIGITTDGGNSWNPFYKNSSVSLNHVIFRTPTEAVTAGNIGVMFKIISGVLQAETSGVGWNINRLFFFPSNPSNGVMVGSQGNYATTTDGGTTWQSGNIGRNVRLNSVTFVDDVNGYIVGDAGEMDKSTDGGMTWNQISSGTKNSLYWNEFKSTNLGFACGSGGTILSITAGGSSVSPLSSGTINALWSGIIDGPNEILLCGDKGTIVGSENGGSTFHLEANTKFPAMRDITIPGSGGLRKSSAATTFIAVGDSGLIVSDTKLVNGIKSGGGTNPNKYSLSQNYPNPFNPSTEFRYQLQEAGSVTLRIYDLLGREVATLVDDRKEPGTYTVKWDARSIASGVYFYRLEAGQFVDVKKLVLMR